MTMREGVKATNGEEEKRTVRGETDGTKRTTELRMGGAEGTTKAVGDANFQEVEEEKLHRVEEARTRNVGEAITGREEDEEGMREANEVE